MVPLGATEAIRARGQPKGQAETMKGSKKGCWKGRMAVPMGKGTGKALVRLPCLLALNVGLYGLYHKAWTNIIAFVSIAASRCWGGDEGCRSHSTCMSLQLHLKESLLCIAAGICHRSLCLQCHGIPRQACVSFNACMQAAHTSVWQCSTSMLHGLITTALLDKGRQLCRQPCLASALMLVR